MGLTPCNFKIGLHLNLPTPVSPCLSCQGTHVLCAVKAVLSTANIVFRIPPSRVVLPMFSPASLLSLYSSSKSIDNGLLHNSKGVGFLPKHHTKGGMAQAACAEVVFLFGMAGVLCVWLTFRFRLFLLFLLSTTRREGRRESGAATLFGLGPGALQVQAVGAG